MVGVPQEGFIVIGERAFDNVARVIDLDANGMPAQNNEEDSVSNNSLGDPEELTLEIDIEGATLGILIDDVVKYTRI